MAAKSRAAVPMPQPPVHRGRQCSKQIVGGNGGAGSGQVGCRVGRLRRMVHAVDADPDRDGKPGINVVTFDQDACELGSAAKHIVRPLEAQVIVQRRGAIEDRVMHGKRRDEGQVRARGAAAPDRSAAVSRRDFRAARLQALPRRPRPAVCSRAAIQSRRPRPRSLRGATTPRRWSMEAVRKPGGGNARPRQRGIKLHQNRERAAALATPISGPG